MSITPLVKKAGKEEKEKKEELVEDSLEKITEQEILAPKEEIAKIIVEEVKENQNYSKQVDDQEENISYIPAQETKEEENLIHSAQTTLKESYMPKTLSQEAQEHTLTKQVQKYIR